MRREESVIDDMACTTPSTASLLCCATLAAMPATRAPSSTEDALWRTVPVISSMEAAVSSRLLACASVRSERSWLPKAISATALDRFTVSVLISPMTVRRFTDSWFKARCTSPGTPVKSVRT